MADSGYGKNLRLHIPPPSTAVRQTEWGDYDFSYNPLSGFAIAWLGHHIVATYTPKDGRLDLAAEVAQRLRVWGNSQSSWRDDDRVVLLQPLSDDDAVRIVQGGADGTNDSV